MNVNIVYPPRPTRRGRVIALHCSGAGAGQWRYLAEALGGRYEVIAPEHYGSESTGPWTGEHAFTLADEAARTIALIDRLEDQVHLVGHSYGGGVALNVAMARPDRVASMALYEPSAFHLLRQMGEPGAEAYIEIAGVARRICQGVVIGDYRGAVSAFVDYWNGHGAWKTIRPSVQRALIRWAPKGPLDFRALIEEPTPADAYRSLMFPVLILRGEHAPTPTRVIAEGLSDLLHASRLMVVDGAGHMGPLTHAPEVSALIVRHIVETEAMVQPRCWRPRTLADILGVPSRPAEAVS
jgi:pimeloyl-ACP methyl ester carboxylesterase